MTTIAILDGTGALKYLEATGAGTSGDPYAPVQSVDIISSVTQDVLVQDSTTNAFVIPFHKEAATTTLASATAKDDKTITVASATGLAAGQLVTMYNVAGLRFYKGRIIGTPTTTVNLDSPIDFEYQIGDQVTAAVTDMAVNGSSIPQIFSIRGPDPGTPAITHVTRILLAMVTVSEPDIISFGNLTALTNGILLRRTGAEYLNYFNAKTNADIANVMYDYDVLDDSKKFGLKARLTFAGQEKLGVAIRVDATENLEIIIQDNLSGLTSFGIIAEGHIVAP